MTSVLDLCTTANKLIQGSFVKVQTGHRFDKLIYYFIFSPHMQKILGDKKVLVYVFLRLLSCRSRFEKH